MTNARLFEPTVLPDHGLSVGLAFIQGAGFRVATQANETGELRHMSQAAARRLARALAETEEAAVMEPVSRALTAAAERLDVINAARPAA